MADVPLLAIEGLQVAFGRQVVVHGVDLTVRGGETLALVGESGSGKSVTAMSVLGLLPYPHASHPAGRIRYRGGDVLGADDARLRQMRGGEVGMIFQEPMTSLNPLHTVEKQIGENLAIHRGLRGAAMRRRVLELLELVRLPDPERRLGAYPHQLSGGQRQRVMIAMALANDPALLIADEPTTALDVTIQAEILDLLADLKARLGMAMLFISHDLNVVRRVADRVAVMKDGLVVEQGHAATVFAAPRHEYTRALLAAEPSGRPEPVADGAPTVLAAEDVRVWFPIRGGLLRRARDYVRAVDGVSLTVRRGETLGIVGESGSGKTTLAFALLRLQPATGRVVLLGDDISRRRPRALRSLRRRMQVVFQDPYGSLNPRLSVAQIVAEGLSVHRLARDDAERERLVAAALEEVGLAPELAERFPHELSGGQRQRVALARAVILKPDLMVLDEPTSALDRTVQSQLVALLRDLQVRHGLAFLFISHDLSVVRAMSHRILVMKDGTVVESAETEALFQRPGEAYTRRLIQAALGPA
ncbi:ABC transporter ATP-binding protein [Arhodomonas aquaeolei]|uniref:ABC transporter ATP-binding protein n=1 Tax=Arhodomonas aquaeolei TaxID=2369 RepID=UPI000376F6A6|nr:ABC transporter ATP-binding protein [Arhodomonas aquaeolei]